MDHQTPFEDLQDYARALVAEASGNAVPLPVAIPNRRRALIQRAVTLAASATLVIGAAGIAAASDSAVPGDILYPVDRSLETVTSWVGLSDNAAQERVAEASILLARGYVVEAVELASESALAGADAELASSLKPALDDAISSFADAHEIPREDLHVAIGELIAAAHSASDGVPGATDVVDAAYRVAEVAKGGAGKSQGRATGRNGDPPRESPQNRGGSSVSDSPGSSGDAPGNKNDLADGAPGATEALI